MGTFYFWKVIVCIEYQCINKYGLKFLIFKWLLNEICIIIFGLIPVVDKKFNQGWLICV